ncbi:MAG: P-II family nitrogen regulator [Planctomycetes bacterium]|nr:P-II family nitrogen regulator [Planctomycetota bacterium]
MFKLVMVVRPQRAELLCQRLAASGWVEELIAAECRGYGRQKGHLDEYKGAEYSIDFLPKVVVSGIIPDERADELVNLVCSTCRTGRIGDGKIFLQRISQELVY